MTKGIRKGKGFGFTANDGKIYMTRCFKCGEENYAMAVATGKCAWCGHDANACPFYTGTKTDLCIKTGGACKQCGKP